MYFFHGLNRQQTEECATELRKRATLEYFVRHDLTRRLSFDPVGDLSIYTDIGRTSYDEVTQH